MIPKPNYSLFLVLGLITALCISSWKSFSTGFNLTTGDGYDGVIENVIATHWYWVLRGARFWNETGYFYPVSNTLGYNDSYFLYGIISAIFRLIIDNQFIAVELAHITIRGIGYWSFYRLSRYLNISRGASICGALVFSIFHNTTNTGHAQLLLVGVSPLFAYLTIKALSNIKQQKFYKYALLSSLVYGAMALTGFYITYFTTLFTITTIIFFSILNRGAWKHVFSKELAIKIAAWLVFILVGILPFLYVYLPKLKETGGHPITEISKHLPKLQDLVNISDNTFVWGSNLSSFFSKAGVPFGSGELKMGFSLIFFLLFIVASIFLFSSKKFKIEKYKPFWHAIIFSTMFWLFAIVNYSNWSLWAYIYSYIPGGKGLRVVSRIYIFMALPTTLIIFKFLDFLWSNYTDVKKKVFMALIVFLIILEQINTSPFVALDVNEQISFLKDLPPPPADCKSFYANNPSGFKFGDPDIDSFYRVNVRSMLVSSFFNLPTITGIASFAPPEWDFAYEPSKTFDDRVMNYVHKKNILDNLCVLDIKNRVWYGAAAIQ